MVICTYCGAAVTRAATVVEAAWFRQARERALAAITLPARGVTWREQRFGLLAQLGCGARCDVFLAERLGTAPLRITLKVARDGDGDALRDEHARLSGLLLHDGPGAAYFSRRLPGVVWVVGADAPGREVPGIAAR